TIFSKYISVHLRLSNNFSHLRSRFSNGITSQIYHKIILAYKVLKICTATFHQTKRQPAGAAFCYKTELSQFNPVYKNLRPLYLPACRHPPSLPIADTADI